MEQDFWEAFGKHLGGIWGEAFGRHLKSIGETYGKHLGRPSTQRAKITNVNSTAVDLTGQDKDKGDENSRPRAKIGRRGQTRGTPTQR